MKPSYRRLRALVALGMGMICGGEAFAHGPLDHSARLTLLEDQLELALTLGADLAREALRQGGWSEPVITEILANRGPSGRGSAPAESVSALILVLANDRELPPGPAAVLGDGLEYLFVIPYPRPTSEKLTVQARYLEGTNNPPPGVLDCVDDSMRRLARIALVAGSTRVELTLPPREPELPKAIDEPTGQAGLAPANADAGPTGLTPTTQRILPLSGLGLAVIALAAAWMGWLRRTRRKK